MDTLAKAAPLFGVGLRPRVIGSDQGPTTFGVWYKINEPNVAYFC